MIRAATTLADPVRALQGATSYWACVVANSPGHKSHLGAHGTEWTLVAPNELARLASLQHVPTRHLQRVQERTPLTSAPPSTRTRPCRRRSAWRPRLSRAPSPTSTCRRRKRTKGGQRRGTLQQMGALAGTNGTGE